MQYIQAKYLMYIGTRNYADVPSMTENIRRDATLTPYRQPIEHIYVPKTEQCANFLAHCSVKTLPGDVFRRHVVTIMHVCSVD